MKKLFQITLFMLTFLSGICALLIFFGIHSEILLTIMILTFALQAGNFIYKKDLL